MILVLYCRSFPLEAASSENSFRDYQVTHKELSDSFFGVRSGVESLGKGLWGLTANSGKLLWYGTWGGLTGGAREAKNADQWLQKNLW